MRRDTAYLDLYQLRRAFFLVTEPDGDTFILSYQNETPPLYRGERDIIAIQLSQTITFKYDLQNMKSEEKSAMRGWPGYTYFGYGNDTGFFQIRGFFEGGGDVVVSYPRPRKNDTTVIDICCGDYFTMDTHIIHLTKYTARTNLIEREVVGHSFYVAPWK